MTLKSLVVATATVKTSGGEFTVRGLSLTDILFLVSKHRAAMKALFDKFVKGQSDVALESYSNLGAALIESAPDVAAEIIALAADEPEEIETVKRISFPAQIEALERIGDLTFAAEGSPKKVVETVIRVLSGATNLLNDHLTSKVGSMVSAGK